MAAVASPIMPTDLPEPRRPKIHVASACLHCRKAHLACDEKRPCTRCLASGRSETCVDVQHKRRGRPRLRTRPQPSPDVSLSPKDSLSPLDVSFSSKDKNSLSPLASPATAPSAQILIPDWKCIRATQELAQALSYPASAFINRPFVDFLQPSDHARFTATLREAVGSFGIWRTPISTQSIDLATLADHIQRRAVLGWFTFVTGSMTTLRSRFTVSLGTISSDAFVILSFNLPLDRRLPSPPYFPDRNSLDIPRSHGRTYSSSSGIRPEIRLESRSPQSLHSLPSPLSPAPLSPGLSPGLEPTWHPDFGQQEFGKAVSSRPPMVDLSWRKLRPLGHDRTPSSEKLPSLRDLGI